MPHFVGAMLERTALRLAGQPSVQFARERYPVMSTSFLRPPVNSPSRSPKPSKPIVVPDPAQSPRLSCKEPGQPKSRSEHKAELPRVDEDDKKSLPPRRRKGEVQDRLGLDDSPWNGVIRPDELYDLNSFMKRLGISPSTMRAARRAGLKVHYVHKRAYVLGRDWIEYVLSSNQKSD
jgi:hypothetical protein